ncbi:DgyrCDS14413 [Dimorphilus gyrociliatus]|uniref:DgyrCDS14413 n=1 Tax=Dimorphilus gyrociliatus TaxID=2664684 RepID=A0A7I8WDQ5_9ANNE|nr:DgyrCDS14413 [Dimorphilus gyrociliatus]
MYFGYRMIQLNSCPEINYHLDDKKPPILGPCKLNGNLSKDCQLNDGVQTSLAMAAYCVDNGTFKEITCQDPNAFIFNDGCYLYIQHKEKKSINEAAEECEKFNSTLLYMSNDEYKFTKFLLQGEGDDNSAPGNQNVQVGGRLKIVRDIKDEEKFTFDDGIPYDYYGFTTAFNNKCDNGQCVNEKYACDNERNCFDSSDENCINSRLLRNGTIGEMDCESFNQFQCEDSCISRDKVCDLQTNCLNGEDESEMCSDYYDKFNLKDCLKLERDLEIKCKIVYDSMGNLLTKVHYPFNALKNCTKTTCAIGEYLCKQSYYCISIKQVCDGIVHCTHFDDENDCGKIYLSYYLFPVSSRRRGQN